LDNLSGQYYYSGTVLDKYKEIVLLCKDCTVSELKTKFDSIAGIYHYSDKKINDDTLIDDVFLIENIDAAFESWHLNNSDMDFNEFCEYLLPYKSCNEMPEYWRKSVKKDYQFLSDTMRKTKNIITKVSILNDQLKWFKTSLNYDYPTDIGYSLSKVVATGGCNSITRFTLFPMRGLGLPVVIDFVPAWANRSSNHYWNSLIYKHQPYPFDATGANIGDYKIQFKGTGRMKYKISKIFRKTFSLQKNSLAYLYQSIEPLPEPLNNEYFKDVTAEYVPVSNVTLDFNRSATGYKLAYLCTFNDQEWVPIFWAQFHNNSVTFKEMGRDVAYLPALYNTDSIVPIGNPFVLKTDGEIKEFKINTNKSITLIIHKKYPEDESNNISMGDTYELFYWDKGWQSLGVKVARSSKLVYVNAPSNTLFLVKNITRGKQERIFSYENNSQIWW
jgi:hypothetical protein